MSDVSWFGPWFGDGLWFGPWFPEVRASRALAPGYGDSGVATFAVSLEANFDLTLRFDTDVIPRADGTEQRIAVHDRPNQIYRGVARLIGGGPRELRTTLEQWASEGKPFLLALPYEEITVASTSGTTATVGPNALAGSDWAKVGQRGVIISPDGVTSSPIVIQDASGTTVDVDVDISTFEPGSKLLPTVAILLDPQQGIIRFAQDESAVDLVEEWQVSGQAAVLDFVPTRASLALADATDAAVLAGLIAYARSYGAYGNTTAFQLVEDPFPLLTGTPDEGRLEEVLSIYGVFTTIFTYIAGVTTVGNLVDALVAAQYVIPGGSYSAADLIPTGAGFDATFLTGAETAGDFGKGATLTMFDGHPVWDRRIQVGDGGGTANESIHSGVEIVDVGAIPSAVKFADSPFWGRFVRIADAVSGSWQWFKKFVSTTRGSQKSFWLPTWRNDLSCAAVGAGFLVVPNGKNSPEIWFLHGYRTLQVEESDGTIHYVTIDHLGEMYDEDGVPYVILYLTTSPTIVDVARISWLQLCRFESDEFTVSFEGPRFSVQTTARVIRE